MALIAGNQSRAFLQTGALPQSVTLSIGGGTYTDAGDGTFRHSGGTNPFEKLTIDYESGQIDVWKTTGSFTSSVSAVYHPAAVLVGSLVSGELPITIQNRGLNYTFDFGSQWWQAISRGPCE